MKIRDLQDAPAHKNSEFVTQHGYALYIGSGTHSYRGYHEFEPNNREPRDTFSILHHLANHLSYKRFGVNIRQGIFSSKSKEVASYYGDVTLRFVPNDGYHMYYNPDVGDFTIDSTHGREYKKIERTIVSHVNSIVGKTLMDLNYRGGRKYLSYLKTANVNYDTFNIIELSRQYFDKEYFTGRDLGSATIERFYAKLGEMWDVYYGDVEKYVDGLKKVNDLGRVPNYIEVITFPVNGFWLV